MSGITPKVGFLFFKENSAVKMNEVNVFYGVLGHEFVIERLLKRDILPFCLEDESHFS